MHNSKEIFLKCIVQFVHVIQHFDCPNKKCSASKDSSLFPMKDNLQPFGLVSYS
jgi:hypothetical protein